MIRLSKKIKVLKRELFFVGRLLEEGYGPRYWWPYIKNRFLWSLLLPRLPKFEYVADPDLELHTICNKNDLWMLIWMLRSFFFMSGLRPIIVINDDGTLDGAAADLIKSKFSNVRIMFRDQTTNRILEMPSVPDIVKQARINAHFFLDKLINPIVFSKAKKIIVSDTDILYYKVPTEVVDFINNKTSCDALVQRQVKGEAEFDLMVDESYAEKYKFRETQVSFMNGGYIVIDKEKINMNHLVEFLTHTKRPLSDYFIEMAGWACVLGQLNFKFLPPERYAIKGFLNEKMVVKHYTSPRRYEMFAYGIDKTRDAIRKIERENKNTI
ncbi:MAG: hypothetical protein A3G02_01260 [Candidatus Yanofskybacteria bacterium RIFCSPLOWO2_12_FULL_44_13b]|uniref:Nucleotide-diphospho-sugar transferase domain-containing protein n=1 Tax=Candidatus Yanofskybacteria bacterium RIFCSPLOWO2_02_FULL_44_18 TaxID=1802705 RepID=A0A1F8H061_9BACT|nr:MAG: hypothetical protein A2657_02380 [Candidatus Yanofskybacteria bacterium RIFCSPHIGHO2_01_FULL_44_110b]OGN14197.1 MAG: hypothetical protein A3C01_01205 [Candidatus Yanofskybacteria bacterium RIFCSPHIGHO2_02_FULL_44_36b]OGN19199.1 MAG: hypothetical protein A3F50_02795 [Candidatus Yanofskybacteria bacterium RIFCSPHIGHO2_12_FULL_44_29b]OGN25857.1 MAG: hypothetical protein A3B12_02735 [Candidatus Yanofskybacteria bacterium RIFCSPLOWO2_01_FULL_44_88]OGN31063.1 MAG: hypothetical protein A3I96_0